jgi:endonuclease YncB( thermonuclease family)
VRSIRIAAVAALCLAAVPAAADIESYAIVQDDATRAVLALDFKIQRFVRCREVGENLDGSIDAFCTVNHSRFDDGEDLGAYLIGEGLALALPNAPFAYHAEEKIARANGRGVWGFQVDSIRRR